MIITNFSRVTTMLTPKDRINLLGPVYTGPDKFGTGPRLGPDRPCVYTGPPGTGTMWVHLPGTMFVHLRKGPSTDLDRSRPRVNGQDRSHCGSVSLSMLSNRNVHTVAAFESSLISALIPYGQG